MELSAPVMEIMYLLSGALLYPTVILLIVSVVWILVALGQIISEYAGRTRDMDALRKSGKEACRQLQAGEIEAAVRSLQSIRANPDVKRFIKDLSALLGDAKFPIESEKLLQDYEISTSRKLEHVRILIRIAPMLGLMGTLIPLGPALMGLSSGNVQALATNLVVAFSTTVLGLLVGGVAYAVFIIRRRWYSQDFSDMEYLAEVLA